MSNVITLPAAARRLGVTERQADYAARTHGIEGSARVGNIRLFTESDVEQLRQACLRIGSIERQSRQAGVQNG